MSKKEITSIFDIDEFSHLADAYAARKNRAFRFWQYYKAEIYLSSASGLTAAINQRISDSILPLFTPLARAVDLDVALIPGGWQLDDESADLQEPVDLIFRQSRWPIEGSLFVKFFCAMGISGLYVVASDITDADTFILQSLRPDEFIIEPAGPFDHVPAMAILIELSVVDDEGMEKATVIEPDQIRIFENGERLSTDNNPLGFVPVVECINDPGDGRGEPVFENAVKPLDQVNLQATHLANIIQKHVEPQWAAIGAEPGDLEKSGDVVWFFPEGSDVKAVLASVDFDGVLDFIKEMKLEVKESLPELGLSKLVGIERVAAATIELQMAEAVFKIRHLRQAIDLCVADALRLAGRAMTALNLQTPIAGLDTKELAFDADRPVLSLDALTRLQIEQAQINTSLQRSALQQERLFVSGSTPDQAGTETPPEEDADAE